MVVVSKDKWDAKENTDKSMKNACTVLTYQAEAMLNSEKNLSHYQIMPVS